MAKQLKYCSFCCKSDDEVLVLIAGPTVFICDECVDLCMDIAAKHRAGTPVPENRPLSEFCAEVREMVAASTIEAGTGETRSGSMRSAKARPDAQKDKP